MYYYYSYFNVAIPMLNGNANKDCCCCCCCFTCSQQGKSTWRRVKSALQKSARQK